MALRNSRTIKLIAVVALSLLAIFVGFRSWIFTDSAAPSSADIALSDQLVEQMRETQPPPPPSAEQSDVEPGSGKVAGANR